MANEDVHLKKFGTGTLIKIPHSIYFYYVGKKELGTDGNYYNKIREYCIVDKNKPLDTYAKVKLEVPDLITNAQRPNESIQVPPPSGKDWYGVVWDKVSWLVIAFESNITTRPDIHFTTQFGGADNNCFFDAEVELINNCWVISCINNMKRDSQYNEIGYQRREAQYFHFDLWTNPALSWPGKTQYPDSGGTNLGPPAPPP